jgi:hypothetical protein
VILCEKGYQALTAVHTNINPDGPLNDTLMQGMCCNKCCCENFMTAVYIEDIVWMQQLAGRFFSKASKHGSPRNSTT